MSPRTSHTGLSRPSFLVDPTSAERDGGHQIDWDVAFTGFGTAGSRVIPHGHPMSPSGTAGKIVPSTNAAGNEASVIGLLEGPAVEDDQSAAKTGYGLVTGGVVYEQLIPGITATIKTNAAGNVRGLLFYTYEDSRDDFAIPES